MFWRNQTRQTKFPRLSAFFVQISLGRLQKKASSSHKTRAFYNVQKILSISRNSWNYTFQMLSCKDTSITDSTTLDIWKTYQKPFSTKEITTIHGIKKGSLWLQHSKQTAAFSETACSIQTQRIIRSIYFQSSYCQSHGNCGQGIWPDDQTVNVRVKYQVQNYSVSNFSCNIYLTAEFCSVWFLFFVWL